MVAALPQYDTPAGNIKESTERIWDLQLWSMDEEESCPSALGQARKVPQIGTESEDYRSPRNKKTGGQCSWPTAMNEQAKTTFQTSYYYTILYY